MNEWMGEWINNSSVILAGREFWDPMHQAVSWKYQVTMQAKRQAKTQRTPSVTFLTLYALPPIRTFRVRMILRSWSYRTLCIRPVVLNISQESLLKQSTSPHTSVSDSVGLVWDLRVFISEKFPGDIDAAGPGNTLFRKSALAHKL